MSKVSVIVPIYNAAVFLPSTIKSIQKQTYTDLEIILVNDCSTDNSLQICKEFAAKDPRIKIVHKAVNGGEDYARFSGIEVATGEYLTFLDADDQFTEDAIEVLLNCINSYDADIAYANKIRVYSEKFKITRFSEFDSRYTDRLISGREKESLFISYFGVNIIPVTMWGNIFKKKLFEEPLKRSGLKFGADLALGMQLFHRAKSIVLISQPVILYRWGGVTAKYQPNFLSSSKALFERKMEFLETIDFPEARRTAIIELVNCLASEVRQLAEYFPKQKEENIRKLKAEMANPIYDCFSKVKEDSYFVKGNLNEAVCSLDAEGAYDIAEHQRNKPKARLRHITKKLALKILKRVKL